MTYRSYSPTTAAKRLANQKGSGHVVVLAACLMIVAVFAAGWQVNRSQNAKGSAVGPATVAKGKQTDASQSAAGVRWQYGGSERGWFATDAQYSGNSVTAPKCPSSVFLSSLVDVSKATALTPPGQYAGAQYRTTGSLSYAATDVQVKLPFDGYLVGQSHTSEAGGNSYSLTFEQPCGVQLRLDHLASLSSDVANLVAAANNADAQLQNNTLFKAGTIVATAITPSGSGGVLDVGTYDLRQPNKISQNAAWASLHADDRQQAFYAVCWPAWLPRSDAARSDSLLRKLPKSDLGASDYCSGLPGGSTLDYNSGQPVVH